MRNKIIVLSSSLFFLGAFYLVAVAVIGASVASRIENLEAKLVARDDVSVINFEYFRDFWGGKLSYDLRWTPLWSNPLADAFLQELNSYNGGFRWNGELDIQHGPWLGGAETGLAAVALPVQLPYILRTALPQYPGKAPVLQANAKLGFSGDLFTTVSVIDYDGRIISDSESGDLELKGLIGTIVYSNEQRRVIIDIGADVLAVGINDITAVRRTQPTSVRLNGLGISTEFLEDVSGALLGSTRLKLAELMINIPQQEIDLVLNDYASATNTERVSDTIASTSSLSVDQLIVNDSLIGGVALESSLRGINVDSYVALENLLFSSSFEEANADALLQAVQALADDQISLNLDRLVLLLPNDEDVTASLSVAYSGSDQIDVENYAEMIDAISLEAHLDASTRAVDRTIERAGLSAEQTSQLQDFLQESYESPYVSLNGDRLSSTLSINSNEVRVNGEMIPDASDLFAAASASSAASAPAITAPSVASSDKLSVAVERCPDLSQSGASLQYTSDDLYSPQSMGVVAGGSADLVNCSSIPGLGFVTEAPDFKLDFSGNSEGRELEFRLDSKCDTILLINDTSGAWHHDDDSNGNLNAKIRLPKARDGIYDIWAGTLSADTCDATLTIETF